MLNNPTEIAEALWQGSATQALPSAGTSQPPGLEATLEYGTVKINNRKVIDRYRITQMSGFQGIGVRSNSEPNPGSRGSTPLGNEFDSRTMMIRGKIQAGNIAKLRDMQMALRTGFTSLVERPLYLRTSNPKQSDIYINARIVDKVDIDEDQNNDKPERDFVITLSASDPCFYSVNQKSSQITLGSIDDYAMGPVATARNLIRNPLVSTTSGYSPNGGAVTAPGGSIVRHTAAAAGNQGVFYNPSPAMAVVPGKTYTASLRLNAFPASRGYTFYIQWSDEFNTTISLTSLAVAGPQAGARYAVSGVAPAGAVKAAVLWYHTASVNGDVTDTSEWMFNEGTNSSFFYVNDGHSKWIGTAHASETDYFPRPGLNVLYRNLITNPTPAGLLGFSATSATNTVPGGDILRSTVTTAGTVGPYFLGNPNTPIEAGKTYTFSVKLVSGVSGRSFLPQITWRNGANANVSTSNGFGATVANGSRVILTATAPVGATQAIPILYCTNAQIGDVIDTTEWFLVEGSSAPPAGFVNGDSYRAHWLGAAYGSQSEYFDTDAISTAGFSALPPGSWLDSDWLVLKNSGAFTSLRLGADGAPDQGDLMTITSRFRTPSAIASGEELGHILKSLDLTGSNMIYGRILMTGATTAVASVARTTNGAPTSLAQSSNFTVAPNTTYWIRCKVSAADITVTISTGDPDFGFSPGGGTITYVRAGLSASQFPVGRTGYFGLRQITNKNYKLGSYNAVQDVANNQSAMTLVNSGNFPAEPKVRFYGPMTNPFLTNASQMPEDETTVYRFVSINGSIPSGRYYEYDAKEGTLFDDLGNNKLSQLAIETNTLLLRSGSNQIGFYGTAMGTTSRVVAIYSDTWI